MLWTINRELVGMIRMNNMQSAAGMWHIKRSLFVQDKRKTVFNSCWLEDSRRKSRDLIWRKLDLPRSKRTTPGGRDDTGRDGLSLLFGDADWSVRDVTVDSAKRSKRVFFPKTRGGSARRRRAFYGWKFSLLTSFNKVWRRRPEKRRSHSLARNFRESDRTTPRNLQELLSPYTSGDVVTFRESSENLATR